MTISSDASTRRESARAVDGRFGHQHHTESGVSLHPGPSDGPLPAQREFEQAELVQFADAFASTVTKEIGYRVSDGVYDDVPPDTDVWVGPEATEMLRGAAQRIARENAGDLQYLRDHGGRSMDSLGHDAAMEAMDTGVGFYDRVSGDDADAAVSERLSEAVGRKTRAGSIHDEVSVDPDTGTLEIYGGDAWWDTDQAQEE